MSYCVEQSGVYFCDWNNTSYTSYTDCFNSCYIKLSDSVQAHISFVDFTYSAGVLGLVVGFAFLFALYKAVISG